MRRAELEVYQTQTSVYKPTTLGVLAGEVRESEIINCSVTDHDEDIDIFYEISSSSGISVGGLIGYGLGLDLKYSFSEGLNIKVRKTSARDIKLGVGGLLGFLGVCSSSNFRNHKL